MKQKTDEEIKLEILWKEVKKIEDEEKCPECNKYTLVHTNPFDYDFLCSNCGYQFNYKELEQENKKQ